MLSLNREWLVTSTHYLHRVTLIFIQWSIAKLLNIVCRDIVRSEGLSIESLIGRFLRFLKVFYRHLLDSILYSRLLFVFGWFLCFYGSQIWFDGFRLEDWRISWACLFIDCLRHHAQSLFHSYYGLLPGWVTSLIQSLLNIKGTLLWCLFNHYPLRRLIPIELKLRFHLELEYFGPVRILAVFHHRWDD